MTPQFFYISDITNSSSFDGKIFRKKSMLENFRANVLKMRFCRLSLRREDVTGYIFEFVTGLDVKLKTALINQSNGKLIR